MHAKLTGLLERDRERRTAEEVNAVGETGGVTAVDELSDSALAINEADATVARAATRSPSRAEAARPSDADVTEGVYARPVVAAPLTTSGDFEVDERHFFHVSQPADAVPAGAISAEMFFESSYDELLQQMVEWVAQREGPILDAVLARRIARAHGFQRTGSRIQERVAKIAQQLFSTTEEIGGTFYWPRDIGPSSDVKFRWPTDDDSTRGVEEICNAELMSLARLVLQKGLSGQEALIAMARELGLQRLREASRGRLEAALVKGQDEALD